jgi:hypothetical protein
MPTTMDGVLKEQLVMEITMLMVLFMLEEMLVGMEGVQTVLV